MTTHQREPRYLILCYDPVEWRALEGLISARSDVHLPGSKFPLVNGRLDGSTVSIQRVPFGDQVELLHDVLSVTIEESYPDAILSIGTAMATAKRTPVLAAFGVEAAWFEGREVRFDETLLDDLILSAPHDLRFKRATSLTTDHFHQAGTALPEHGAPTSGALILEMEDFHLASISQDQGIPAASLRLITDHGSFEDHLDRVAECAHRSVRILRRFLRRRRGQAMTRRRPNPATQDLPYRIVVESKMAPLSIPDAVRHAREALGHGDLRSRLRIGDRIRLEVTSSDSGRTRSDDTDGSPVFDNSAFRVFRGFRSDVTYAWELPEKIHVQGLGSISAEPEEGLLAATTLDELEREGYPVGGADESRLWVYRTADADKASYFRPGHALPQRQSPEIPARTHLLASGLGPVIDPASEGGREAHTLFIGDEQGGRLIQFLDDLTSSPYTADDVCRYPGVIHRLDDFSVVLSRIDQQITLTTAGLNALEFNPDSLRRIYSADYDKFLERYFSHATTQIPDPSGSSPTKPSYLLMTSRGCALRCSMCCSGGFQAYQPIAAEVFTDILKGIRDRHSPSAESRIDIFLLDSYFNLQPARVMNLANHMRRERLLNTFRFHVRHSGLRTFLKSKKDPDEGSLDAHNSMTETRSRVHEDLIEAYRVLGIQEIVMGVDSYTEASIRILKTDVNLLRKTGSATTPFYSFRDILDVLLAIDVAGLKSRCFLLAYNPFISDQDRIETFYNLIDLANQVPGFMIDTESSEKVNELKPFPGAPITQVALKIPGLIQGSRFTFRTALGRIEDSMNFRIFNSRRQDLELRTRFHLESQEARLALITGVKRALAEADLTNPMDHSEAVGAVETLLGREARIGQGSLKPPPPSLPKNPARELQDRIEVKLAALTRWRETAGTNACFPADARSQQFYEILQAGRRY